MYRVRRHDLLITKEIRKIAAVAQNNRTAGVSSLNILVFHVISNMASKAALLKVIDEI